jgi:UTP--glucose-1-phosphate uridylyltransferase
MIMMAKPGCLKQVIDIYHESGGGNVLAAEEVAWDRVDRYGVVVPDSWQDNHFSITGMVEKPKRDAAPSNLIISGRYILQPEVFTELNQQSSGAGGEIQITDAMIRLMGKQPFRGVKYVGTTYDCGDKIGLLSASVVHTLQHETFGSEFRDVLSSIVKKVGGKLTWGGE